MRPSTGDTYFKAQPVHAGVPPIGLSHPIIFGLTVDPPTGDSPVEIVFRTANSEIENFKLRIKSDNPNATDSDWQNWTPLDSNGLSLRRNHTYVFEWDGSDNVHDMTDVSGITGAREALSTWRGNFDWILGPFDEWILGGRGLYKGTVGGFLPGQDPGGAGREIDEESYRNAYLEVEYDIEVGVNSAGDPVTKTQKFRYYLRNHRDANAAGEISAALQTGLTVASIAPTNPYVLGAGAAVAVGATAGSIINRAREGERINLSGAFDTPLTPTRDSGGGFQVGQYVFCHTYSNEERTIETIPSKTTEMMLFDFESIEGFGNRTQQIIEFTLWL